MSPSSFYMLSFHHLTMTIWMTIAQIFVPIQHHRDDCVCLDLFTTTTTPVALSKMTLIQNYYDDEDYNDHQLNCYDYCAWALYFDFLVGTGEPLPYCNKITLLYGCGFGLKKLGLADPSPPLSWDKIPKKSKNFIWRLPLIDLGSICLR